MKKQSSSRYGRRKRLRDLKSANFYNPKTNEPSLQSSNVDIPPVHKLFEQLTRKSSSLTETDVEFACRQLGYVPYNLVDIAARTMTSDNICVPLTLKLYPLNKKKRSSSSSSTVMNDEYDPFRKKKKNNYQQYLPFPTMMWLSCPETYAKISKLEDRGWISRLQDKLNDQTNDESAYWRNQMENAHKHYAEERWASLSDEDKTTINATSWVTVLKSSGVAGMQNFASVKCLHTHFAHHKARPLHGNIIGQWVDELLSSTFMEVRDGKIAL